MRVEESDLDTSLDHFFEPRRRSEEVLCQYFCGESRDPCEVEMGWGEVASGILGTLEEFHESLVTFFRDLHDFQVKCVGMLSDSFQDAPEDAQTLGPMG